MCHVESSDEGLTTIWLYFLSPSYGDKEEGGGKRLRWRVARLCRDIAKTWCDLTNETSDLEEGYFARVKATATNTSSKWTITPRRFDPKHDSKQKKESD